MQRNQWYIAVVKDNSRQIILYDPVSRERATERMNGIYLKENSRKNVRSHGDATWHAWLWVFANDGTIYWIDPTWTDNAGYVWWGIVQNGREVQMRPLDDLCMVAVDPNDAAFTYTNSGNASKNMGNWDQAIEEYTSALRINPNNSFAYAGRGYTYYKKSDYDRAISDYTQSIRLNQNYAVAYDGRGFAYYQKGDYDRAITDYTQAVQLDPKNSVYINNLAKTYDTRGFMYYNRGDYDRAIADYTQAIRLNPDNAVYINNLAKTYDTCGFMYYNRKDYDQSIANYEKALQITPNNTTYRKNLEFARRRGR
jgi:tetratricopeptide (TPR) repeat protein